MLSDRQTDYRLRVNRVNLIVRRSLPVYPKQRTSPDRLGWSVFEPVLVSLEARPACHGAMGSLQRRLRCRGRRSVGCVGA